MSAAAAEQQEPICRPASHGGNKDTGGATMMMGGLTTINNPLKAMEATATKTTLTRKIKTYMTAAAAAA